MIDPYQGGKIDGASNEQERVLQILFNTDILISNEHDNPEVAGPLHGLVEYIRGEIKAGISEPGTPLTRYEQSFFGTKE